MGVYFSNQQLYQIDACSHGGAAGQFFDNTVAFTAENSVGYLRFEFISVQVPATAKIDNVVIVRT